MAYAAFCATWRDKPMNELDLSLVVPVYNAAPFIEECINSVKSQLPKGCELVLVDDGSTDNSADIIRTKFSEELKQSRFALLQIANSGPGEARNTGVRAARGQYVGFLDSDDILLPGYFDAVLDAKSTGEPHIVQFHIARFRSGEEVSANFIRCHNSPEGIYALEDVRDDIFAAGKWFPVTRVFRKDLLLKYPFPTERVFYEDLTTLPFMFLERGKIVLLDRALTAYRDNPGGTTRNHRPEHAATLLDFFARLSQMPRSTPIDILRVQLARTIVYFATELRLKEVSLRDLFTQIRDIPDKARLARRLRRADAAFLWFPGAYALVERVRHGFRQAIG